jgi:SulP family sulfate permease
MTGIGAIIILLQIGPFLGFDSAGSVFDAVAALPAQVGAFDVRALVIGTITLAIVFVWRGRLTQVLPSPLLALVVGTVVSLFLFTDSNIERIGEIPSALPTLLLPTWNAELIQLMVTNALMLAVLGSIDSLLTSLVADSVTGTQHRSDQELIGQGVGNVAAGLIGGLPGAGATMRTMINIRAGGTGPLSGAVHALVLLGVVSGMGFLFEDIPLAALAAILIKVGIDIIDWPFLRRLHRIPLFPALLMMTVLLLTVFVDLITAVFVGVFVKNLVTIDKLSDLQLGMVVFSDGEHDSDRLPSDEREALAARKGEALLVRITGPISYAVGRGLTQRFRQQVGSAKLLVIDIADASIVGISSAMALEDLIRKAQGNGVAVRLIGAHVAQHHELQQLGLIDLVGAENCVESVAEVFQAGTSAK